MRKRLIILGSTGSIGRAALDVVAALSERFEVVGLAAGNNRELLAEQTRRFRPQAVALSCAQGAEQLRRALPEQVAVYAGSQGARELVVNIEADLVLAAIVGAAGLPATLAAVERGLDVALANKESLVVAGALLVPLARHTGSRLIPVDSEHSAVFQAIQAGQRSEVHKIYLTASGGPFRDWPVERIAAATLEEALRHPTWDMGPKITIDSATMMNKALEVIEAVWLFDLEPQQVEVLIHPESIVHSLVEFCDGSVVAQLGTPDMKTPIQYALTWPQRVPGLAARLSWNQVRTLRFEPPDTERFPALALGYEAARRGGSSGAVLNAANEAAVELFRRGEISFGEITALTRAVFERHQPVAVKSLEQLLELDAWARREVLACCQA